MLSVTPAPPQRPPPLGKQEGCPKDYEDGQSLGHLLYHRCPRHRSKEAGLADCGHRGEIDAKDGVKHQGEDRGHSEAPYEHRHNRAQRLALVEVGGSDEGEVENRLDHPYAR